MVRIKTTTTGGKEFLSPFVYTLEEAEKLISRMLDWHDDPKYETVPISKFPRAANPDKDEVIGDNNIIKAEYAWRGYRKQGEEIEEKALLVT